MLNDASKTKIRARLARAEGQLAGLGRMLDRDDSCVDILLQISAVQGALGKVAQILMRYHIDHCVTHACACDDAEDRRQKLDELMEVFVRYGGLAK